MGSLYVEDDKQIDCWMITGMIKLFYSTKTVDYLVLVMVSSLFSIVLSAMPASLSTHSAGHSTGVSPQQSFTMLQVIRPAVKEDDTNP